jgi:hypothetical protein
VGFFAAFACRHDERLLALDQVSNHPDTIETTIKQQERDSRPQGEHALDEPLDHIAHGLFGVHTAYRQGITAALVLQW